MRMSTKIKKILRPSYSGEKKPKADSNTRRKRMIAWVNAGTNSRCVGSAGSPNEMEERESKTVAW